jgi:ADP-ribose pyrophosphatase YjhB (NUDIX family)
MARTRENMDIISLLDELQSIARNGLHYASNPYDRERYEQLLDLATQAYGELLHVPPAQIKVAFLQELGQITPKVGADAALFNERGEILLMERVDGSGWCLPCGWVGPNESPSQAAVREAREETGLEVRIKHLVGVFTRLPNARCGPHTMVAVVHLCEIVGGELTLSHEGTALRYWPLDEVPVWHANHEKYARAAHACWKSDHLLPAVSA